jgi:hypothetical protein
LNPNLGRSVRSTRASTAVLPIFPEIATPNPLTGGAIGFGGGLSGGGGSASSASPALSLSTPTKELFFGDSPSILNHLLDNSRAADVLDPANLLPTDPADLTGLGPTGALLTPEDVVDPPVSPSFVSAASAVPEPATMISTLTGLTFVAGALWQYRRRS